MVPTLWAFILPKIDQTGPTVCLMTEYLYNHQNCGWDGGDISVRNVSQTQNGWAVRGRCLNLTQPPRTEISHSLQAICSCTSLSSEGFFCDRIEKLNISLGLERREIHLVMRVSSWGNWKIATLILKAEMAKINSPNRELWYYIKKSPWPLSLLHCRCYTSPDACTAWCNLPNKSVKLLH